MSDTLVESTHDPAAPQRRSELLRRFLEVYWLRPENACWMALRSDALAAVPLSGPAIDVGCGDGLFMFLHLGGRLAPVFDVFGATGHLERVTQEHADMFDCPAEAYAPAIVDRPHHTVSVGADLKPNLLAKAGALGFYEQLVEHDGNEPMPFADDTFETTYCNSAYWMQQIEPFLAELARITRKTGQIIVQVKLDSMRACTLEGHRAALGDRFLAIIGRGRFDTWPSLASQSEWERRFAQVGLSIKQATPLATATHARLWDVGLRPLAPLLVRMTQAIHPETRLAIKRDWIELCHALLEPVCRPSFDLSDRPTDPAEIQYVLTVD